MPIEDLIKQELPLVSNAMLIGDNQKFLCCLLTLKVGQATLSMSDSVRTHNSFTPKLKSPNSDSERRGHEAILELKFAPFCSS